MAIINQPIDRIEVPAKIVLARPTREYMAFAMVAVKMNPAATAKKINDTTLYPMP
jgi:hypothetical protein